MNAVKLLDLHKSLPNNETIASQDKKTTTPAAPKRGPQQSAGRMINVSDKYHSQRHMRRDCANIIIAIRKYARTKEALVIIFIRPSIYFDHMNHSSGMVGLMVTPRRIVPQPIRRQCFSILRLSAIFSPTSVQIGSVSAIFASSPERHSHIYFTILIHIH